MTPSDKISVFKQLFLTLWAMTTLILCFVVALLINEMLKSGENPLEAFTPETGEMPEPTATETWGLGSLGTREIALYFVSEDGHWLSPENRVLEYHGRTVENCRNALLELLAGPKKDILLPLLPAQTQVRAVYLRANGELVIDLPSEMLTTQNRPRSAEMEALMAYGIVNTMTQETLQGEDKAAVHAVRFLFDGALPLETFPAHLDLSAPLVQDRRWTRTGLE